MSEDKVLKEMTTEDMVDDHNALVRACEELAVEIERLKKRHEDMQERYMDRVYDLESQRDYLLSTINLMSKEIKDEY